MDGEQEQTAPRFGGSRLHYRDLCLLALLLLLTLLLKTVIIYRTAVCARDAVIYINYALQLETEPFAKVLREHPHHPGYPMTILAVSWPIRWLAGATTPYVMQLSAQIAAALASLLMVVPMYFLYRMFFSWRTAFWGTLFFQIFPVSGQIMTDGLTESLFFCCALSALMFAIVGLHRKNSLCFALAGMFVGLTYLTRPEGGLLLLGIASVLVAKQYVPAWRWTWSATLRAGVVLVAAAALAGAPYYLAAGTLTNKTTPKMIFQTLGDYLTHLMPRHSALLPSLTAYAGKPQFTTTLGGLYAIFKESMQAFHYLGGLAVLLGLWNYRKLAKVQIGYWVMVSWGLFHFLALLLLTWRFAYLSDRHVLVLVVTGSVFVAAGLRDVGLLLAKKWNHYFPQNSLDVRRRRTRLAMCTIFLLFVALCLPKTLKPMHHEHAGHRAAGRWLADHIQPGDSILDQHTLAHYYSGIAFQGTHTTSPSQPGKCYFVLYRRGYSREAHLAKEQQLIASHAVPVFHWPQHRTIERARVVVYASDQHLLTTQ